MTNSPRIISLFGDMVGGLADAVVVEDYSEFPKGPAVLVTAHRPDPRRWSEDFLERRDE